LNAEKPFEVLIAGGAVVGAALARALRGDPQGAQVALISPQPRPEAGAAAAFDSRVYAISPGNAVFLEELGAWGAIAGVRKVPVHGMRVHGDDGESLLEFDAYRCGCAELAWIVEDRLLQEALWRGLDGQNGMALFSGAAIQGLEVAGTEVRLALDDGRRLGAKLVVGTDGAHSVVRSRAGIPSTEQSYGQSAVVANFACAKPHRNLAFQWFGGSAKGGAVLALLPLPGEHVSMVWSVPNAEAQRLLALDGATLSGEVAAASRAALGELSLVSAQRGFPLRRLAASRLVAPRIALAGDAAHVIHPLAGQGANLGLQDARALAAVLAAREPGRDPGELRLLRRYERSRAEANLAMAGTVHGLFRLFDAPGAGVARLRNAGLNLADRLPVLKNLLMRQAMS